MIDAISGANSYITTAARARAPEQQVAPSPARSTTDEVTLSRGGKLLSDIAPISLDPVFLLGKADAAMKLVMEEMGIPEGTPFDIEVNPYGRVIVEGDHEKTKELEQALNSPQSLDSPIGQLVNNLKGAANAATIQRIAKASQMASEAAEKNPAREDFYYDWLLSTARDSQNLNYRASFGDGPATGTLMSAQGVALGNQDDLVLPT